MIGFLMLLSLALMVAGIWGVIRGRVKLLRIQSRKASGLVVSGAVVLFLLAGAMLPKPPSAPRAQSKPAEQPAPIKIETPSSVFSPQVKKDSPRLTFSDLFTETQVYVECSAALGGMSCSIERRAGNQDVTACWEMEFVCINGSRIKGSACQPVQPGVGSRSTRIIQWTEFDELASCDQVRSFAVARVDVRRN